MKDRSYDLSQQLDALPRNYVSFRLFEKCPQITTFCATQNKFQDSVEKERKRKNAHAHARTHTHTKRKIVVVVLVVMMSMADLSGSFGHIIITPLSPNGLSGSVIDGNSNSSSNYCSNNSSSSCSIE